MVNLCEGFQMLDLRVIDDICLLMNARTPDVQFEHDLKPIRRPAQSYPLLQFGIDFIPLVIQDLRVIVLQQA